MENNEQGSARQEQHKDNNNQDELFEFDAKVKFRFGRERTWIRYLLAAGTLGVGGGALYKLMGKVMELMK